MSIAPPIVTLSERLLVEIEKVVRKFDRYHKYSVGADLRAQAMKVAKIAQRAWRDRKRQAHWVGRLVEAVDDIKMILQVGSQLRAFPSFAQFEVLVRMAKELGKQVGGWKKQQHPSGQNEGPISAPQRPEILSTRAASIGAIR